MSVRTERSIAGILRLPLLRVQRTGDRHTVREMHADVTVELPGVSDLGADTRIREAVEALAAADTQDPEDLALSIARYLMKRLGAAAAHVDLGVHRWTRLDIGGRPRGSDFARSHSELRTAHASVGAAGEDVSAGLRGLQLLAAASHRGTPQLVELDARWTYGWADVPFDTQWQQVRRVIVEAYAERAMPVGLPLAHALGHAVLDESPAVRAVEIELRVRTFEPSDVTHSGIETSEQFTPSSAHGTDVFTCAVARAELQDLP